MVYFFCSVSDFAKKTGDYASLSATDIQVIALTYQLEKEHVGVEHLRTEPVKRVIAPGHLPSQEFKQVAGFFVPKSEVCLFLLHNSFLSQKIAGKRR